MNELTLVIPLMPPSVNHYWIGSGKWTRVSPAGKAFKKAVAIFSRGETVIPYLPPNKLKKVSYSVTAKIVLGKKVRGDVDNCWKGILDGLVEAGVIHSDDRVLEQHGYKDPDERPEESRTELTVKVISQPIIRSIERKVA